MVTFVQSGMGKDYARSIVRGAVRLSADAPEIQEANLDLHHSPGFVALSVPKDGEGDTAIEVFDFEINAVRSYQDRPRRGCCPFIDDLSQGLKCVQPEKCQSAVPACVFHATGVCQLL